MSHDDKTIITFRRDNPASGSDASSGIHSSGGTSNGGFQRPMPGGRGTQAGQVPPPAGLSPVIPTSAAPLPGMQPQKPGPISGAIPGTMPEATPFSDANSSIATSRAPLNQAGAQSSIYINPLVHCANDAIDWMARLRSGAGIDAGIGGSAPEFRDEAVRLLRDFERRCGQLGIDEESILYARYILCTVMDEFATKTPWGDKGAWSNQSLLSQFHDETGGGEKFFQILEHLQTQPATYLHVLELMYIAMSLGFEGKYSLINRGNVEIENLRDNLFHLMRLQRGEAERDLSPHWQGVSEKRYALMKHVPVWVVSAIAGVVLLVLYSGFSYQLSSSQESVLTAMQAPIADYLPPLEEVAQEKKSESELETESAELEQSDGTQSKEQEATL